MTVTEQKDALRAEIKAMAPGFDKLEIETLETLQRIHDGMRAQINSYARAGFEDMRTAR